MDDDGMGFDDDDFGWDVPDFRPPRFGNDFMRNNRYSNAFGDYRGGYGPPGSYLGPPRPPPPSFNLGFEPMTQYPNQNPFTWGQGFGPRGPPPRRNAHEDKAFKYLLRCGVAREHIRNLPKALLRLIEPQYCGVCGQNFDSYAMSRIHYTSKNHLKNQKKWLSKKSEMGKNANKEEPLRARELYCELCDVHITSKSNADAHYAGKPHRAVVEGRKAPKNPVLLQPKMRGRVEQLIRREKKCLKTVIEQQKEVTEKEPPKPTPSELFCDICKTSVTCTEQMTMHLNGKRHLNKEKQHILKMMRGETAENNDTTQEDAAGAEDADVEGEEDDAEAEDADDNADEGNEEAGNGDDKNNAADDGFDWGNGSGVWDEPTPNNGIKGEKGEPGPWNA